MRLQLRSHARAIALVALTAIGASACVKQNLPGVGLVKFDSSAVFGQSKGEGNVPGFGEAGAFPDQFALPEVPLRDIVQRLAPKSDGPCPAAKLTAFPNTSASVLVKGRPTEGVYKWKRDLFVQKNAAADPSLVARPFQLEARVIRRVTVKNDHDFTFEMISPDPFTAGQRVVTSFEVNSNPTLLVERTVPARTIGVVTTPYEEVRLPPPNDMPGVFITRIQTQKDSGTVLSSFSPLQPMLILPLDGGLVRSGQTFQNVAIDPNSVTVLAQSGLVGRTARVDACGEIVEGYAVTLNQVYSGDFNTNDPNSIVTAINHAVNTNQTRSVTYVFATQYGVLPIGESLSIGDITTDSTAFIGKWELGGLTPVPLTDSLK